MSYTDHFYGNFMVFFFFFFLFFFVMLDSCVTMNWQNKSIQVWNNRRLSNFKLVHIKKPSSLSPSCLQGFNSTYFHLFTTLKYKTKSFLTLICVHLTSLYSLDIFLNGFNWFFNVGTNWLLHTHTHTHTLILMTHQYLKSIVLLVACISQMCPCGCVCVWESSSFTLHLRHLRSH